MKIATAANTRSVEHPDAFTQTFVHFAQHVKLSYAITTTTKESHVFC